MNMNDIKIVLGDAYELIKRIPPKSVDLVVTDPPYLFSASGGGGAFGTGNRKRDENAIAVHSAEQDYIHASYTDKERKRIDRAKVRSRNEVAFLSNGFQSSILDELIRRLRKINIYVWCSRLQILPLLSYFDEKRCNTEILTWHKNNALPACNNCYVSDTEYCIFARERGVRLYGSAGTKHKYYVSGTDQEDKSLYGHPTVKPLPIIKNLIINSSREGDLVLDPFLGSGTTAVACAETGRRFVGFEIEKKYYDIAADRLNGIAKKDREAMESGQMNLFC